MDIYLIRHLQPDIAAGICYGRLDVPPAPGLEAAADRFTRILPLAAPIVTTQAQRCRRLAQLLATALSSTLIVEDRLRELDFGEWEGRAWADIPRAQTDVWSRDVWNRSAPGGESYAAMHARVGAAWEALLSDGHEALVLVGHAGPLRALITIALELPLEAFIRIHLDYGGTALLSDRTGGWRLEFANRI